LSDVGNGVAGVHAQVSQNLVYLGGIYENRPEVRSRQPIELDVFSDEALEHFEHAGNRVVQIEHLGRDSLFAGKGQQLPRQIGGTFGAFRISRRSAWIGWDGLT
jgi:hypothetical protein